MVTILKGFPGASRISKPLAFWCCCAMMLPALSAPNVLEQGLMEYRAENYEEALVLFEEAYAAQRSPKAARLLGLTYYRLLEYPKARPLLEMAFATFAADARLNYAWTETLLVLGEVNAACARIESLRQSHPEPERVEALAGRIYLALGETDAAIAAFERARQGNPIFGQGVAEHLVSLYAQEGQIERARRLARTAIETDPASFEADMLRALLGQLEDNHKTFKAHLGYRIGRDSNVILEPTAAPVSLDADRKSDLRSVFTADLLGRYPVARGWELFGEAHLYQSLHNELEQFDETRHNYVLGLGWTGESQGARFPYEFTGTYLDGNTYLRSHTFSPGVFTRLGDTTLNGFVRFRHNHFDEDVTSSEVRGGNSVGAGITLLQPFLGQRGQLRLIFEGGRNNSDGRNWRRDEYRVFASASYRFLPHLSGSLGFEYGRQDYTNLHDLFLVKRRDKDILWFGSLFYRLNEHWEVGLRGVHVDHRSTIGVYDYERSTVSLSVSWHY